jgi:hypothetical protein
LLELLGPPLAHRVEGVKPVAGGRLPPQTAQQPGDDEVLLGFGKSLQGRARPAPWGEAFVLEHQTEVGPVGGVGGGGGLELAGGEPEFHGESEGVDQFAGLGSEQVGADDLLG